MEKKKLCIWSLGMLATAFILGLLKNVLPKVYLFAGMYTVLCPLLLIAAGICGYYVFRDKVRIPGKSIWAVLGILLWLVFQKLEAVSGGLFVTKAPAAQVFAALLYAAGGICLILSVLDEKFWKLQDAGFAALAVSALCGGLSAAAVGECLIYVAFVVIARNFLPGYNYWIRIAAVILTVLCASSMGIIAAVCWILFAFILVPADKSRKIRFSFARLTALLCLLAMVAGFIAFVDSKPMMILKNRKDEITKVEVAIENNEKKIPKLQEDIVKYQDDIKTAEEDLQKAKEALTEAEAAHETAIKDLERAKKVLKRVCTRSSYNYWYCDKECKPLHEIVENKSDAIFDAENNWESCEYEIEDIKYSITKYQQKIKDLEQEIKDTEKRIVELKEDLSEHISYLWAERFTVLVNIVAALLNAAALALLAFCFFKENYGKNALFACGAMALGALLPLLRIRSGINLDLLPFVLQMPNVWKIMIAALLARIFTKKEGKLEKYRVLVIIAAVILSVTAMVCHTGAANVLYAVAMICAALVLVPPVFTEYNSIAKHLFYTFISLGLWQLIWIYHVTKNLNRVGSVEERKPTGELLLCMFLPFYYSFWLLKTAENVEAYAAENGRQYKLDVICLVFAFICPLVSTVLLQNKINMIVGKPE